MNKQEKKAEATNIEPTLHVGKSGIDVVVEELKIQLKNRKMVKVMGFNYTRIIPISRGANSSSGSLSEQWGIKYHSTPQMRKINSEKKSFIQYADLSSLVKMLNIKTGGGVMDAVNEGQKLLLELG